MIIKQKKLPRQTSNLAEKTAAFFVRFSKYILFIAAVILILLFLIIQTNVFNPRVIVEPGQNFFQETIEVSLSAVGAPVQSEIRYTLDGSDPSLNTRLYNQPFELKETTVLKAAVYKDDQRQGEITTHDFFFDSEHTLPIVSIVTQPDNLWDPNFGIYVVGSDEDNPNYNQRGNDWQRPAVFHYYEPDQQLTVKQEVGLRIHGGGSRGLPQKSFRLYASMDNEGATFNYKFFPNYDIDQFSTLILRNSGNDWEKAFMRDVIVNRMAARKSEMEFMTDQPVVVYLNGEYWGIYYLRDRFDKEYIHQKFGIDHSEISLMEQPYRVGSQDALLEVKDSRFKQDAELYQELLEAARACQDCANYRQFEKYFDMDSLIDYYIFQLHFANGDWPLNNIKLWRSHNSLVDRNQELGQFLPPGLDGKFRWYLYDADLAFAFKNETEEEVIEAALKRGYDQFIDPNFPFENLFYDPTFQEKYFNRYANFLNTTFKSDFVIAEIEALIKEIGPEMPRHIDRWKDEESDLGVKFPQSFQEWLDYTQLLKVHALYRQEGMINNSLEEFSGRFQGYQMVNLSLDSNDTAGGNVRIHQTIIPGEQLPFSGVYFPNLEIEVEAVPQQGYQFKGWEGNIDEGSHNNRLLKLKLDQDYDLKAIFDKRSLFWFNM